jgi:hypothetical protein
VIDTPRKKGPSCSTWTRSSLDGGGAGSRIKRAGDRCEAEIFGYGPKPDQVRAEHENELTVLVERERAVREREL